MPEGALVVPVCARQRFVDQRDREGAGKILPRQQAARHEANARGIEVAGRHRAVVDGGVHHAVRCLEGRRGEGCAPRVRHLAGRARGRHVATGGQALRQILEEPADGGTVVTVFLGQQDPHGEAVRRVETRVSAATPRNPFMDSPAPERRTKARVICTTARSVRDRFRPPPADPRLPGGVPSRHDSASCAEPRPVRSALRR